ncbi:serine hydrolase [Pseudomonas sp. App30]|uniref:serine hydrolase domain-containing protein n=1 Tax=Pseudomonas sp. App30 TaxID=3068990 RepID=UPI003A7F77C4
MSQTLPPTEAVVLARHYARAHEALLAPQRENPLMQGFPPPHTGLVTWGNWMSPPFNRWGFRHLAQLRPTIEVAAGAGCVGVMDSVPQALENFHFESSCGLSISLAEHLEASNTDAFMVLHQNKVVFERYYNGQQPDDRHVMFSVTKSLIGVLAEQLIADGILDAALPADYYVPEFGNGAFADATVRQLLDMAVGVQYTEKYDDPHSESSQFGYACGFLPAPDRFKAYASLYQFLPSLRKSGEHGGFFHYVTATTEALAWVMERAAGISCAQMLTRLWSQLGCQRDGYFMADPWGRGVAGAGFSATLRDMARFGLLLASGGTLAGQQLLAPEVINGISCGGDAGIYARNTDFSKWTPGASYRSQWYVFNDHSNVLMAGGIHGQYLFVDMTAQVVIVKQSSLPQAEGVFDADSVRLMRALASHLNA